MKFKRFNAFKESLSPSRLFNNMNLEGLRRSLESAKGGFDSVEDVTVNLMAQRKFYEQELIKMGFFKTEDKRQLYELSLYELKEAYWNLLNK